MMIKLTIDDKAVDVAEDTTLLEAAKSLKIKIPTLCYNTYLKPYGGCRICLVEITTAQMGGHSRLVSSCTYPAEEGLKVFTATDRVKQGRIFVLELLLARCPESADLKALAEELGISYDETMDEVGNYLIHDAPKPEATKCILCGLCVRVCAEVTKRNALSLAYRGANRKVTTPFNKISETCIGCGSCAYLCPTNTITVEEAD
ncbi:MAG TPA: 2Fe-2S iron-sulfur cluster binding domain-containing protein [Spirochaetes bacterium]|nr:2Fe-2S iron-sulfur cluster binding domain-containing protein [Spirochaetota bacterium]